MYPDLFTLGPLTLHTYGMLTVLGWFLGVSLMIRRRDIAGLSKEQILDLSFAMILSAVLGARILYVLVEWRYYSEHPLEVVMVQRGGLVFYGGFLLSSLVLAIRVPRLGVSLGRFADMTAPALALGHGLGRIGCFLNGCCYGKVAQTWALHFPKLGDAPEVRRIPAQLWEAGFNLTLAGALAALPAARMRPWRVFASYLLVYGTGRFALESLRDDPRGSIFGGLLTTSQAISALVFVGGILLWTLPGRGAGAGEPPAPSSR